MGKRKSPSDRIRRALRASLISFRSSPWISPVQGELFICTSLANLASGSFEELPSGDTFGSHLDLVSALTALEIMAQFGTNVDVVASTFRAFAWHVCASLEESVKDAHNNFAGLGLDDFGDALVLE